MAGRRTRAAGVIVTVAVAISVVVVTAYVNREKPHHASEPAPIPVAAVAAADGNEASAEEFLALGTILGSNRPAPPPMTFMVGPGPDEAAINLSSPAVAVYSILELIDRGATDGLADCFVADTDDPPSDLYPRYLGPPVALVETTEEDESAQVIWQASVHTAFSRQGRQWSPGETMTLTTQLVQTEGFWKVVRLHNGGADEP